MELRCVGFAVRRIGADFFRLRRGVELYVMRFAFYELTLRDDILVAERGFAAGWMGSGCESGSISDFIPDDGCRFRDDKTYKN